VPRTRTSPSARRVSAAVALLLAVALPATSCQVNGSSGSAQAVDDASALHLQPVAQAGPDAFTASTANEAAAPFSPQPTEEPPATPPPPTDEQRSIIGSTAGLYGGTTEEASCEVEKQIRFLEENPDKARAFAQTLDVAQRDLPRHLRSLTSVVVRADTLVTNHGFVAGRATPFQSVLQAGTAVLVDDKGLPRVRCACGNPLTPPATLKGTAHFSGTAWRGFNPNRLIVVEPSLQTVTVLVIVDVRNNVWIERSTRVGVGQDVVMRKGASPDPFDDDTRPPTAPAGLIAEATGPDAVRLSWEPADDDTGVTDYRVFQDNNLTTPVKRLSGNVTGTEVTGLEPDTDYTFAVKAADAEGNVSDASNQAEVTTEPLRSPPTEAPEPTTPEPTTHEPTTPEPTTHEPTTPEPTTPEETPEETDQSPESPGEETVQ
jgi:uncharacterized protein DUF6777/fibronectin type III domain protein